MRSLELIQADIVFLLKQKARFFSRIFSFGQDRLKDLRREEAKAIDALLLAGNSQYKRLAEANTDLLKETRWSMDVTERTSLHSNVSFPGSLAGEIEAHGYIYARRIPGFSLQNKNPSIYTGSIDHFGKISLEALSGSGNSFSVPRTFKCFTDANVFLTMEKDQEESLLAYNTQIKSIIGDPFNGNERKRHDFLQNRQKLLALIASKKVAAE